MIDTGGDIHSALRTPTIAQLLNSMRAQGKSQLEMVSELVRMSHESAERNKLALYRPYPRQVEFHNAGKLFRERGLIAANRVGKTYCACAETTMHLTGLYPDYWGGYRFDTKTRGWACGVSMKDIRDSLQKLLLGEPGNEGTGLIPFGHIIEVKRAAHSVADAVDRIVVRHVSGGKSTLTFKSYEGGRESFQADTLDFAHVDEEPDEAIYTEILTRTSISQGPVYSTLTPLKGSTNLVNKFLIRKPAGTAAFSMTIYDAMHFTPEAIASIIEAYPEHERDVRTKGIPRMGSGSVFGSVREENVLIDPLPMIPDHWPRICAIDFGFSHATALTWLAIDRDTDTTYVYDCYRVIKEVPAIHRTAWGARGEWIPCAWPADGLNATSAGDGVALAVQYRNMGMKMIGEPAMLPAGGMDGEQVKSRKSVEAQIMMMLQAMKEGRLKIYKTLEPLIEEFRMYYRDENGKIVKQNDDAVDSLRYAWISRRYAETRNQSRDIESAIAAVPQNWRS